MKKILLVLITLLVANALADLKTEALPNNRIINVTGHPDYAPVVWKNKKTGKLTGIAVELIEMAFSEINVKVNFINTDTWGRAQEEVGKGSIDMLLPPYLNDERVKVMQYHKNPMMMDDTVIIVAKGKSIKFSTLSDLQGLKGTAIISDSFGDEFDKYEKTNLKISRLATTEQCLEFLLQQRADYMVAGYNSGLAVASKMGLESKIEILPKRVIVTGMYSPISKKSPWNIEKIHNYLADKIAEYSKSGITKKLEEKYLKAFKDESK